MRAQISLEYLIVLSVSIGGLALILPVTSRVEDLSKRAVLESEVDRLSRELSTSCEGVWVAGPGAEKVIETDFKVNVSFSEDEVRVFNGEVDSKSKWIGCRVNGRGFKEGEEIVVSRTG